MYPDITAFEEGVLMLLPLLTSAVPSSLFGIATYVLSSMALYSLASRRCIGHAWLSWVPLLNVWILGSLSDQYSYVVKGQNKSKRKSLLVLNLLAVLIVAVMAAVAVVMAADLFTSAVYGADENMILQALVKPVLGILGLAVPLAGIVIAAAVIRFMALYDVYRSMDPDNSILFLVLSILFGVTEPFFLFFNRQKDNGMPPRRPEPQWEPAGAEETDYL